jgi:hypothetical protein
VRRSCERQAEGLRSGGSFRRVPSLGLKLSPQNCTIDHLSGGRLEFGIGAGGAEIEHAMLGIPFHSSGERIRRLGEALTVCRKLWTEERSSFADRYHTLTDAVSNPKPLQQPHPPIWIGGAGEKLTLAATRPRSSARSSRKHRLRTPR